MITSNHRLIFLGTGTSQGVPVIGAKDPVSLSKDLKDKRLRASAIIETQGRRIIIDCGPDFRQQMLREDIDSLDAIIVTHEHNDHIIGLDDVRPLNFKSKTDMPIFAMERVINEIKMRFPYAFTKDKYPGVPSFELNIIKDIPFKIKGIEIIPIPIFHGNLPILGYRIGNIAYLTDVSKIPQESMKLLEGLDVLVLDALRQEVPHHSHLLLKEAVALAETIQAKKTYFTHISHHMGFHEDVNKQLPLHMNLAYDGLTIEV